MAGPRKEIFTTPKGFAEPYCSLQKPDYGNPEKGFGNPRGLWKVDLTVPSRVAQPLIDKIVQAHEANYKKLLAEHEKNPPVVPRGKKPLLPYEGDMPFVDNGDGTVTFKIKGYASYIDKNTQENKAIPLKVVDSKGKRIDNVPAIAGGSELKVKFTLFPYGWTAVAGASVKLQIDSVMLLNLKEFDGGNDWADDVEEGGYSADDSSEWEEGEAASSRGHAEEVIPDGDNDGDF
ncbi:MULTISPECIES: DUF2815 family protein [Pseudomonas]|uniref:Single-stranded DNA-binding protein n=1 Tax=Pseudomonas fildesensis TaxID=1674920 RepID=A0A0J8IL81_9PSED|nr:DUF2815 family protein [Pseudomonas fildesensis]KMT52431.1 single-stranded DNA-binding protein [Pseudomonas fildesensis]